MKTIIAGLILFATLSSQATVYIMAYDQLTGAMGQAVASSGPAYVNSSRIQVRSHGIGLVGAGGLGLCGKAKAKKWLQQGLSATEIVQKIARVCDREKPYYRVVVVTADGDLALHLGPDGCNAKNRNCAALNGGHFGVIGGGMKAGVLQATFDHFASLDPSIPLECRLLSALRKNFSTGGEFKNFKVANIVVSYPSRSSSNIWQSKGKESGLLPSLTSQLARSGANCPF